MQSICMTGGPVFDGTRYTEDGNILFNSSGILSVNDKNADALADAFIDVGGRLIMPGLVDLHSDALEKCIEMRPGVFFDHRFALQNLDRRLAGCGITSYCHAVSFGEDEMGLRNSDTAEALIREIKSFFFSGHAQVRHLVHARLEIGNLPDLDAFNAILSDQLIDMVSIMDHTPGQGQFKTIAQFRNYYGKTYALSDNEVKQMADRKQQKQAKGWINIRKLIQMVQEYQLPILSHDDDTSEKVALLSEMGVTASEFPITMEAARKAKSEGMRVFMGSPNMIRGASSNGHMCAADTVAAKVCDGLISDYYPESLVQSPFVANRINQTPIEDALRLVTSGPGGFLTDRPWAGQLIAGGPADIIVVDTASGDWVNVDETWIGGRRVFQSGVKPGAAMEKRAIASVA